MPALTRRRILNAHPEAWLIHSGDIRVGTLSKRAGVPGNVDQWGWACGFYPASHRGVRADGTAKSFDEARADFAAAWQRLLPKVTEADFDEHRRYLAFDAWKRTMWDAGCKLPTQVAEDRSRCFCGAEIGSGDVEHHIAARHMPKRESQCAAAASLLMERHMTTRFHQIAEQQGIPLRTKDDVRKALEMAKKTKADDALARVMLRHGRLTGEARDYVAHEYPQCES
jgi:hypothetical protein